jgi:hypothetical protein
MRLKLLPAALMLLFAPVGAHAQPANGVFYQKESQALTRWISTGQKNKRDCLKIRAQRSECVELQERYVETVLKAMAALDEWQLHAQNLSQRWEGKIKYNHIMVEVREIVQQSWVKNFFSGRWKPADAQRGSGPFHRILLKAAQESRRTLCPVYTGVHASECEKEIGEYIDALEEISDCSDRMERARESSDRVAFFQAYVDEAKAIDRMTVIQARVSPKYFP